jgi:hypothetical protein
MEKVTLKGQFCVGNVKVGKFANIDFMYDGVNFHLPEMLDVTSPHTFIKELDAQFGGSDWDCFELIMQKDFDGNWYYTGDYGRSHYIEQYNRDEWEEVA